MKKNKIVFGKGPYELYIYTTKSNEEFTVDNLNSFTLFILKKDNESIIQITDVHEEIKELDAIQVENKKIKISIS